MSRHVAPERWAELAAGRVDAHTRAAMELHATECERCRKERARVEQARAAFASVRRETPPLGWESLGARLHWTISSELKRREREAERTEKIPRASSHRWMTPLALSVLGASVCALGLYVWSRGGEGMRAQAEPPARSSAMIELTPPAPTPAPPTQALEGLVTLAEGEVLLDGKPLAADAVLRARSRLTTGAGRVHVQFGDASGFVLEPRSVLELAAFDAHQVELRVEGAVGVQVAHRGADQRFAVVAAGRRVEVRGTIFRVAGSKDGLEVTVTRGRVVVTDGAAGSDEVEIPAGSWLRVPLAVKLAGLHAHPMNDAEAVAAAQRLRVSTLALWPSRAAAQAASAVLHINAPAGTPVSIDDIAVGKGPVVVRVPPGRHLVGAGGRSRWVETEPGVTAEAEAPSVPVHSTRISERARQVEGQLAKHHQRFEVCANRVRAVDPDYTDELVVEIDIGSDGSLRSVVAVKGLPDQVTESCLLDVIRQEFMFPPGSRDTVRKSLRF
jgi:ferric-dicitrate binding protein FerR (iron transport regulator)